MRISAVQNNGAVFGRRLSRDEQKELSGLTAEAGRELNLDTSAAIIFDFSLPKKKHDGGLGTSFSNDALKAAEFLKAAAGINAVQLQPQGQISDLVRSPYSGSNFSLGIHLIDLDKLTQKNYGRLLNRNDLNAPYLNKTRNPHYAEYKDILSAEGHKALLKKAYDRFVKLKPDNLLVKEYKYFKKNNENWLERDSLYEAAAVLYGTDNIEKWPVRAQYVYAGKEPDEEMVEKFKKVTDIEGRNISEFEKFAQFIADKQQKESVRKLNKKGIDVYGDCLIGCSQKDFWTHRSAYYGDLKFGQYNDKTGQFNCWGPAFNFDKLDGEAGELLRDKFDLFFKRYNGVRIDAAWQLINPLLLKPNELWPGHSERDEFGNEIGEKRDKDQRSVKGRIIDNILLRAADDNGIPHKKIVLEMLGGNAYDSLPYVKGRGMTLLHLTQYGKPDWGRVKYYEGSSGNPFDYQNMRPGEYIIGPGTHDDKSLISQFDEHGERRAWLLADDLGLNPMELRQDRSKWTDAAFAELYTTSSQFASVPDILGEDRRINEPGNQSVSWGYRTAPDFRQQYYENLSEGRGLNYPDALSKALKAKGKNPELAYQLSYYADILREKEPEKKSVDINA